MDHSIFFKNNCLEKEISGYYERGYLPDLEKWPAPSSHLNRRRLSSVFVVLSFATNLAGSEYRTRGSGGG